MITDQSPFAGFYDDFFATAPPHIQETFLRQLFTRDTKLCSSFYAFVNPPLSKEKMTELFDYIKEESNLLYDNLTKYNWETLFDLDPTADDYASYLIDILDQKFTGDFQLKMEVSSNTGDLLLALANLRVIELGLDLDWSKVEEPAVYHKDDVYDHIRYQFDDFITYFDDNIFSIPLIKKAIELAVFFKNKPGKYFNHSKNWERIVDTMEDQLKKIT